MSARCLRIVVTRQSRATVEPSKSHKNGFNGDLRFLRNDATGNPCSIYEENWKKIDEARTNNFIDKMYKFGWKSIISQYFNGDQKLNHVDIIDKKEDHYDHIHIQNYNPTYEEVIK